jgi:putative transposase
MNTTCTHPTSYATDMNDAEWAIIAPYINHDPKIGSPRDVCMRCVMNALFYIDRTGCQWNLLPKDLPNYGTVYYYFRKWQDEGTFERMNTELRQMVRERAGRDKEPSLAIVDSQSVKTTDVGGDVGFNAHKQIKGRKRHILVDILGLILVVVVTNAAIQDTHSARHIGARMQGKLPRVRKIIADQGYKEQFVVWFLTNLQLIVEIVQRNPDVKGFDVVPKRWIVERTFAWMNMYRRLSKDYEYHTTSSEAMIYLASIRWMLKRCANRRDYPLSG